MCCAKRTLVNNFDEVRIARAYHALRVCKPVHVNGDPTAVQEYEVRISDHTEVVRTISLDEEFFRVPSKTEHVTVARSELIFVYRRRPTRVRIHVRFMSA